MADKDLMKRAWDITTRSGDKFNLLDFETRKEISKYMDVMKILTLYQVIESNKEITTSAWRRKMRDWLMNCVNDYEKQEASE